MTPNDGARGLSERGRDYLLGTFLKSASYQNAELLALAGLDCLVVDAEHAPFNPETLDMIAVACRAAGMPMLVRLPALDPVLINRSLDLGATGIVVPHVRSADDARRAVAAARYSGTRGFSPSTRAGRYGAGDAAAYREHSDATVSVWVQIEDGDAIARIEEIAAVPGVACLFVGRADLALSLGIDDPADGRLADAVRRVGHVARAHDRTAGLFVSDLAEIPARAAEGYRWFLCGSDQSFLLQRARTMATLFGDTISALPDLTP